ncbi:MAG: outer membrane lipoprotein-sorting protein [Gammaproteobacteria bacterium]|nr:outer membrane lipoprotein-sorting protein [Gammaproteobacteria bacterium]
MLALLMVGGGALADGLTVEEIVQRTEQVAYYQGDDGKARVTMTITDGQDRVRNRRFLILRRDQDENAGEDTAQQKYFVYIKYPADVKNTVFMVWKNPERDDDRWLYLPALDLVKRIAAGDQRTSFLGSDFYYEDISGRSINKDRHRLTTTTDDYYVLDSAPKQPEQVDFARFTMWIHRESFVPVRVEYFDAQDRKYREYEVLEVATIQGHPTVMKSRMKDLRDGGETVLAFDRVAYDLGLPEEIFSERYLRHLPVSYLK